MYNDLDVVVCASRAVAGLEVNPYPISTYLYMKRYIYIYIYIFNAPRAGLSSSLYICGYIDVYLDIDRQTDT